MIKPKFGQWIFNQVFWVEFVDHNLNLSKELGTKPDQKFTNVTFKQRFVYFFFLHPWYDVYSRIAYLNGDVLKAPIWRSKNLRNPNWHRWLNGGEA